VRARIDHVHASRTAKMKKTNTTWRVILAVSRTGDEDLTGACDVPPLDNQEAH